MRLQNYNDDFTAEEIKQIYNKLPDYDKFVIDDLAKQLQGGVPTKQHTRATVYFGYISALELLMKLGIWMVKNDFGTESK